MTKILIDRSKVEQWLEALEALRLGMPDSVLARSIDQRIYALKAALAEPEQCADNDSPWLTCKPCAAEGVCKQAQPAEPVAWRWGYRSVTTGEMDWRGYVEIAAHPNLRSPEIIMEPLYTAPPQRPAEPVQEPNDKTASIRWQLCLLAQTEEFSDDVRNQIGRGVWLIDRLRAALAEPTVEESLQVESAFAENATTQQQLEEAPPSDYRRGYWDGFEIGKRKGRIEAENALAEPVQEFATTNIGCLGMPVNTPVTPPQTAEPVQEPVAYSEGRTLHWHEGKGVNDAQLYLAPAQRLPLTEEEIWALYYALPSDDFARSDRIDFARAVERAHKIGGEG